MHKVGQKITLSSNHFHGAMRGKQVTLVRHIHYSVWIVYCPGFYESKAVDLSK